MFGKKRLCEKMLRRVDIVKMAIYKVAKEDLLWEGADIDFSGKMAAAVVNELFCSHTASSEQVMKQYGGIVRVELKWMAVRHPELKQPITDALRVYFAAKVALKEKVDLDLLENAMARGLLVPGGAVPSPDEFLDMATSLYLKIFGQQAPLEGYKT